MTDTAQAPKTSIQQAIERAKSGAGALAAGLPTIETPTSQTGIVQASATGVGTYDAGQPPMASLDAFLDAGVNIKPDVWIGVKATGFSIKDHTIPIETLGPVGLSLPGDMQAFYGLRLRIGGQAVYYKTADRRTCLKTGRPWGTLIAEAAQQDEREYKGFDIRFVALQDIVDMKGKVVIEAGKTLGYTTSVTNYDDWATFAKKVRTQGLFGEDLILETRCDVRKNDKNKDGWGAMVVDDFTVFTAEVAQAVADAS
jgi:hypothetical protein